MNQEYHSCDVGISVILKIQVGCGVPKPKMLNSTDVQFMSFLSMLNNFVLCRYVRVYILYTVIL